MTRKSASLSRRLIVLSLFFASQISLALSQESTQKKGEQDQAVRLKTELVELRAVVTDKKGNPISDLKKEDFEVLEDGVRQEISFFSLEKIQSRPEVARAKDATLPPAAPPTSANAAESPARTVVLFVDTLHLSTSSFIRAKQQLKQFIDEQLTDQDLVAVVTTSSSLGVLMKKERSLLGVVCR